MLPLEFLCNILYNKYINHLYYDYLHENVENDADITLKISADNRMQNYSGMSGSPVIYKNGIIGILTEQTNELSNFENKAIALKMISMKKVRKMLDAFNINYIECLW